MICHGQNIDTARSVLLLLGVVKDIAVIGGGISGLAAAHFLSRRHRVHLFERETRLGGHTHTVVRRDAGRTRAPRHGLPRAQRPDLSEPGAALRTSSAWPRRIRTCRSPCRAGGAASNTAAAAPTASSRSGATSSAARICRCSWTSCASTARRRGCSRRRAAGSRRSASSSSRAASARRSSTGISCRWRRRSGRRRSMRFDRFPRSR